MYSRKSKISRRLYQSVDANEIIEISDDESESDDEVEVLKVCFPDQKSVAEEDGSLKETEHEEGSEEYEKTEGFEEAEEEKFFNDSSNDAEVEEQQLFSDSSDDEELVIDPNSTKGEISFQEPIEDFSFLCENHWKWSCPYSRLGLPKNCSDTRLIKRHYRKLCLMYHPDKCKMEDATERFMGIQEAYNNITSDE